MASRFWGQFSSFHETFNTSSLVLGIGPPRFADSATPENTSPALISHECTTRHVAESHEIERKR